MTLDEIERKLGYIAEDLKRANTLLTLADGETICPVKYHEARRQFSDALNALANFRDELHAASWSSQLTFFNS